MTMYLILIFKEGRLILALGFRVFSTWLDAPLPQARQSQVAGMCYKRLLPSLEPESSESNRKESGVKDTFLGHVPSMLLPSSPDKAPVS